jgi:hypothetical protein
MNRSIVLVVVAVFFGFSTACSQHDDSDRDAIVARYADAVCGHMELCRDKMQNEFATKADCVKSYLESDKMSSVHLNTAAVQECTAALLADTGCTYTVSNPLPCYGMWSGTAPTGTDCNEDHSSCNAQSFCKSSFDAQLDVCYVCTALAGISENCAGTYCEYDLTCGSDLTCVMRGAGANGVACMNDDECATYMCLSYICAGYALENEDCLTDASDFAPCAYPLICDNNRCVRPTLPTANGSRCNALSTHLGNPCVAGSTCRHSICQPLGGQNADCWGDEDCQSGFYCRWLDPKTCRAYGQLNESCSEDRCGPQLRCNRGAIPNVCATLLENGQDCEWHWDCVSEYCNKLGKCDTRPACKLP